MFGKKESIFDKDQNKQLQQLIKNQKVLIGNNDYFIKSIKSLWSWITDLNNRVKDLEARMSANEKKDLEQAQLFASLSTVAQTEEEPT